MPDIGNIGYSSGSGGAGPIARSSLDTTARTRQTATTSTSARVDRTDRVELSDHAKWLDVLRNLPPVRAEKVATIKAAIEAGTYETEDKLNVALDRLLEEIGDETDGGSAGPNEGS
ncbi:MAG: flagellar biosynthesis anti-sigma factor FlgM [Phycisphaerae bacterium]|nr:flagellar biosynthesis anti-sigma factor FlgM [Phycisphaerae bacterium]